LAPERDASGVRPELPTGTVTFLFTDVEGSTRLLRTLGPEAYAEALAEHRRVIREACASEGGVEVDTQGDAFFFAFPTAPGAIAAASAFTEALDSGPISVRVGLHTGTPLLTEEGYIGDDVHFGARVAASSHGGQIILSQATFELVEGAALVDLGEHRLKDIEEAVSIYQLGEGAFPPLKTISNTNLPRPASRFLGREAELREVLTRFQGTRLLTLTGPGGTGKTRLAIEAASALVPSFKAGAFWVGLASLRDPALVSETIAQTLGAKDSLVSHIGERELLLLLDNLEQVVECAPELSHLLEACPNLTLLCTSRELLRIQGEVEYPVPPLAEPEAVALFCARSGLEPTEEIAELCTRLDSLPLAVELAAARTKALTPVQILGRLSGRLDLKAGRDADPRQQTLRATIEWSYELLSSEEQELFARLSVFAGGCTFDAAEDVCGADLDTLQSLVEKSLLRFTPSDAGARYWMLETIREYAGERLGASESADVRDRHFEYFLRLAEPYRRLETTAQAVVVNRLASEEHNLRLALTHAKGHRPDRLLDLVSALGIYWTFAGGLNETRGWAELALELGPRADSAHRADTLLFLSAAASRAGDTVTGIRRAEEAVAMYRSIRSRELGRALVYLGNAHSLAGHDSEAESALVRAVTEARSMGDHRIEALGMGNLGYHLLRIQAYERAMSYLRESAALQEADGNRVGAAAAFCNAGLAALRTNRLDVAQSLLSESIHTSLELGHDELMACCLEGFAWIAARSENYERAARLQGAAEERLASIGAVLGPVEEALHDETRVAIDEAVGDNGGASLAAGRLLDADQAVEYALASID
jgi:predicted ATPase/class 3 adenylate cyclase